MKNRAFRAITIIAGVVLLTFGITSCDGCGDSGDIRQDDLKKDVSVGLNNDYLLYSAYDGHDYEIYLLAPQAYADTAIAGDSETLQLTDNNTDDLTAVIKSSTLAWLCDDGAGSELCVIDLANPDLSKAFKQVTDVAGGGALGNTVSPNEFRILLSPDGKVLNVQTDPDGRGRENGGYLSYKVSDGTTKQGTFAKLMGFSDLSQVASVWQSFIGTTSDGLVLDVVGLKTFDDKFSPATFVINSAGDAKQTNKYFSAYSGNTVTLKDSFLVSAFPHALVKIKADGTYAELKDFGKGDVLFCGLPRLSSNSQRGNVGIIFHPYDEQSYRKPNFSLYIYKSADDSVTLVKDFATLANDWNNEGCIQDEGASRVLVSYSTGADTNMPTSYFSIMDTASGQEVGSFSEQGKRSFIKHDASSSLDKVLIGVRDYSNLDSDKLIVYDVAAKMRTDIAATTYDAWFANNAETVMFDTYRGDISRFDLATKDTVKDAVDIKAKFSPLGGYYGSGSQIFGRANNFVLTRTQDCPAGKNCMPMDKTATVTNKLYRVKQKDMIDLGGNGRDLVNPLRVSLTPAQFNLFKQWFGDKNARALAAPKADTAGLAIVVSPAIVGPQVPTGGITTSSGSSGGAAVANITPSSVYTPYRAYSIYAFSRSTSPSFAFKQKTTVESPIIATKMDFCSMPMGCALGIWSTATYGEVLTDNAIFGSLPNGGFINVSATDGTSSAADKVEYKVPAECSGLQYSLSVQGTNDVQATQCPADGSDCNLTCVKGDNEKCHIKVAVTGGLATLVHVYSLDSSGGLAVDFHCSEESGGLDCKMRPTSVTGETPYKICAFDDGCHFAPTKKCVNLTVAEAVVEGAGGGEAGGGGENSGGGSGGDSGGSAGGGIQAARGIEIIPNSFCSISSSDGLSVVTIKCDKANKDKASITANVKNDGAAISLFEAKASSGLKKPTIPYFKWEVSADNRKGTLTFNERVLDNYTITLTAKESINEVLKKEIKFIFILPTLTS